jgi:hypothetical protein
MRKTYKHISKFKLRKTRRGGGVTSSKPKLSSYPVLPETPTNRPMINTKNEDLKVNINVQRKRFAPLARRIVDGRRVTWRNWIVGRKRQEPKVNENGYPKSFFTINKNIGFKPNSTKF